LLWWSSVSFAGEFSPNSYLKNMISTYRKDFAWKNDPNSPDFEKKILSIARLLLLVPISKKIYRKILIFSYVHISKCGQIWLNHFPDDSHFGYITKLEKETLLWRGDHFKLQVGINRYAQDSTIMMLGTIFLAIPMGE
jgi:hypothetical protein